MPELTREEKLKLVEKLPQRLQDFLYSEDTGAFLLYIGKKYNLPDEKVSALSKIIADIILKITPITSLAQEIASKVIADHQPAMAIAQELNDELLAPVLMPIPAAPPTIAAPTVPVSPAPMPAAPVPAPISPPAQIPSSDKYREPTTGPGIVDLRKTPPSPRQSFSEGGLPSGLPIYAAPIPPVMGKVEPPPLPANLKDFTRAPEPAPAPLPKPAPRPLTFTKPVEPPKSTPLIEAEPHVPVPKLPSVKAMPPLSSVPKGQSPLQQNATPAPGRPQYIIRPPGFPPTDTPHGVLDLRKDRGEF